jgi:hypothetical protein
MNTDLREQNNEPQTRTDFIDLLTEEDNIRRLHRLRRFRFLGRLMPWSERPFGRGAAPVLRVPDLILEPIFAVS